MEPSGGWGSFRLLSEAISLRKEVSVGSGKKTKVCVPSYLNKDALDAAAAVPVAEDGELVWVDGAVNLEDVSMHAVQFKT